MATRRSLTSRGFTSVNAGVSSTNRFLKPPRAVGEYTTVSQELADLRTAKNAVGPAAQPLRPRARVDAGGEGEGYSPTAAESPQVNYGKKNDGSYYISTPDLSKQVQDNTAKLTDTGNLRTGIGLLGPTPVSLAFGALGLLAGSEVNRATDALYDRGAGENILTPDTDFDETNNPVQQQVNNVTKSVLGAVRGVGNFIDNPVDFTKGVVDEEFVTPVVETYNSAIKGIDTLFSKVTPSLISPPITKTITTITEKANPSKAEKREERSLKSKANQVEVDLREAKEKQQKATLASVAAANARGRNSNVGNRSSSTSSTGNSGFSSGSAVDFGGGNNFSSDF